jgi:multisubunit Na+/H+ antiporter MnhE subunit
MRIAEGLRCIAHLSAIACDSIFACIFSFALVLVLNEIVLGSFFFGRVAKDFMLVVDGRSFVHELCSSLASLIKRSRR